MNIMNQGVPLGRWFGVHVFLHFTFLIYAAFRIFGGGADSGEVMLINALFFVLLFATVLLHEFGHALSCKAVGGQAYQITLWPLGGMAFVLPPMNPLAWLVTTVCGPLVNAVLWPLFYFLSKMWITQKYGAETWAQVVHEIGGVHSNGVVTYGNVDWWTTIFLYMWQMNKLLLLFNLIPAYPMDGGRIFQELLWFVVGYPMSLRIAGMVGTVTGGGLLVVGLGLRSIDIPAIGFHLGGEPSFILMAIGIMTMMQSYAIYQRSSEIQGWRKQ